MASSIDHNQLWEVVATAKGALARSHFKMASSISLQRALELVAAVPCSPLLQEIVPLSLALGRTLAEAIESDGPWPATDRSAMDGFALLSSADFSAGQKLSVVGASRAGHPFVGRLQKGQCVRIMTGAVLPDGADSVVPVEQTSGFFGDEVELFAAVKPDQHVRLLGSECRANAVVMPAGIRIRAAEIGALAVLGITAVKVALQPRVAILATGDEVVPVTSVPLSHQVRESNSWALAAQVCESGGQPNRLGVALDEAASLRALLQRGIETSDVLLTIGGISKGTHDLVHAELAALGVERIFHGIELKPGKPTFFGQMRRADRTVFVFGLPGNPASCFSVFDLLVRPLLCRLLGQPVARWTADALLAGAGWQANSRLQAVPARLVVCAKGTRAELAPASPSGDPFSMLHGDGYALLPAQAKPGECRTATFVSYASGATQS